MRADASALRCLRNRAGRRVGWAKLALVGWTVWGGWAAAADPPPLHWHVDFVTIQNLPAAPASDGATPAKPTAPAADAGTAASGGAAAAGGVTTTTVTKTAAAETTTTTVTNPPAKDKPADKPSPVLAKIRIRHCGAWPKSGPESLTIELPAGTTEEVLESVQLHPTGLVAVEFVAASKPKGKSDPKPDAATPTDQIAAAIEKASAAIEKVSAAIEKKGAAPAAGAGPRRTADGGGRGRRRVEG